MTGREWLILALFLVVILLGGQRPAEVTDYIRLTGGF
jgi:hypothetical protein